MARPLYTNNAASSLAAGITSTQTTIQLSDGMGNLFPTPVGGDYFYATIVSISLPVVEIVKCTARSGDYLTVVRGEEGTVPLPFNINDGVQLRITAAGMNFLTGQAVTSTEEETQTATQGQTVFTLVNFDYSPGTNNLAVFVNGSKQVSGVNYSETSVNTVTFNTGLNAGDIVEFLVGVSVASGTLFANDVQYNEGETGAVTRTVASKLQESVSVKDFGAVGDGVTDDTDAIQAALYSGAGIVTFSSGNTYLINGGLTTNLANQNIIATGAIIKLKNTASNPAMFTATANNVVVDGGTWNANRINGNSSGTKYNSYAIGLLGNYCVCKNAILTSSYGSGIYGLGNYLLFQNNNISDNSYYGILIEGGGQNYYGNKAIGNFIDSSAGGVNGQGILFTSGGTVGDYQIDWEISNNTITGPQGAIADQAINIGVRGIEGIVSNNTTRYGSMGFSEGGSGTIVSNNRFFDLAGTYRYGIEPSGSQLITGNYITNALMGIIGSGESDYDAIQIVGNTIQAYTNCVTFQNFTGVGKVSNALISGNNFIATVSTAKGINLQSSGAGTTINSNFFNGTIVGVFLDEITGAMSLTVSNNNFKTGDYGCRAFSTVPATVSQLYNYSNTYINVSNTIWTGNANVTLSNDVVSINNIVFNTGAKLNIIDQATNLLTQYGTGTPEGSIIAAIGSVYYRTNGGAGTTLYVKESGTGNTGWVGK